MNSQFGVFLDLPGDLYVNRGRRLQRVSVGMIVDRRSKDTHRILLETLNFEENIAMELANPILAKTSAYKDESLSVKRTGWPPRKLPSNLKVL